MTNVNDIKIDFDALINAPQQGTYTPESLNVWINKAVDALYKQRLGLPEQYDMATAIPRIAYARTKKIHVDLKPYRKHKKAVLTLDDYVFNNQLPDDLYFETSVRYFTVIKRENKSDADKLNRCGCKPVQDNDELPAYIKFIGTVELVEEDKWAHRVNSKIIKKAIYLPFNDGWRLYFPVKKPSYIEIDYLKRPTRALWNYDIVNDEPVYNAATSVDVEFDEMLKSEIVARMVKYYGLNVDDGNDVQYANQATNTGE